MERFLITFPLASIDTLDSVVNIIGSSYQFISAGIDGISQATSFIRYRRVRTLITQSERLNLWSF